MEEINEPTPSKEPLEPKPPKTIQHIEWLRRHGWRYRWHILVALIGMAITTLVPICWKHFVSSRASAKKEKENSATQIIESETDQVRTPSEDNKIFLTTRETPAEILQALREYSDSERNSQARAIYVGRWLKNPWVGNVLGLPKQSKEGLWSVSLNVDSDSKKGTGLVFAILSSAQDASQLRPGMRIRATGKIGEVRYQAVYLSDVSFEVIP
jgi:hypothetical protein